MSWHNICFPHVQCTLVIVDNKFDTEYLSGQLLTMFIRIKSGNLGHHVNSDSDLVCFIFLLLEQKN